MNKTIKEQLDAFRPNAFEVRPPPVEFSDHGRPVSPVYSARVFMRDHRTEQRRQLARVGKDRRQC